ncbi:MAG: hypothetical protein WKF80_11050, partial [Thermomicrobiales bacterium]
QGQYRPMPVQEQVAILWAGTNGMLTDVPVERIREFEAAFLDYLRGSHADLLGRIASEGALSDELIETLRKATTDFKAGTDFAVAPVAATATR